MLQASPAITGNTGQVSRVEGGTMAGLVFLLLMGLFSRADWYSEPPCVLTTHSSSNEALQPNDPVLRNCRRECFSQNRRSEIGMKDRGQDVPRKKEQLCRCLGLLSLTHPSFQRVEPPWD
jgi:hypothetical protein